jgi:hypothetical protein
MTISVTYTVNCIRVLFGPELRARAITWYIIDCRPCAREREDPSHIDPGDAGHQLWDTSYLWHSFIASFKLTSSHSLDAMPAPRLVIAQSQQLAKIISRLHIRHGSEYASVESSLGLTMKVDTARAEHDFQSLVDIQKTCRRDPRLALRMRPRLTTNLSPLYRMR